MSALNPARGERVRALRKARQHYVSQDDVALAVGVNPRTYQNWEAGKGISSRNLSALAGYFGTTTSYIEHGIDGLPGRAKRFRQMEREMRAQVLEAWAERGTGSAAQHAEVDQMLDRFRELIGLPQSDDVERPPAQEGEGH